MRYPNRPVKILGQLYDGIKVFIRVEVLRPSQPIRVKLSAVSLSNHTFPGQA